MPRSSRIDTLAAVPIRRAASRTRSASTSARRAYVVDVDVPHRGDDGVVVLGVLLEERVVQQVLLHEDGQHRGQQERVAAGPDLEVEVGHRGGLAAPRVDDDQRPGGVGGDRLQRRARVREAVGHPRVLAHEDRDLGPLEVRRGVRDVTEQVGVDPELTGLLLRQRVGGEAHAERRAQRPGVDAAEVVRPARRRRSRRSTRRRARRAPAPRRAATSAIAVSQPTSS